MAVIVKYIVERNGVEKMTFISKAEADAYDKMLDIADELTGLLQQSQVLADEQQAEVLALYLAEHKEEVLVALGAKKAPATKKTSTEPTEKADKEKKLSAA